MDEPTEHIMPRSLSMPPMTKEPVYCTQLCILGACNRGEIDRNCPNAHLHPKINDGDGRKYHDMDRQTLCRILGRQLKFERNCLVFLKEINNGFVSFIVSRPYGYTLFAKGVSPEYSRDMLNERAIYEHLENIQGDVIPVCLGCIRRQSSQQDLRLPNIILVTAWAGISMAENSTYKSDVANALKVLHRHGVKHGDLAPRNVLLDGSTGKTMLIDFGMSEIMLGGRLRSTFGNDEFQKDNIQQSYHDFVVEQVKTEREIAGKLDSSVYAETNIEEFHKLRNTACYDWFHKQLEGDNLVVSDMWSDFVVPTPDIDDIAGNEEFWQSIYGS